MVQQPKEELLSAVCCLVHRRYHATRLLFASCAWFHWFSVWRKKSLGLTWWIDLHFTFVSNEQRTMNKMKDQSSIIALSPWLLTCRFGIFENIPLRFVVDFVLSIVFMEEICGRWLRLNEKVEVPWGVILKLRCKTWSFELFWIRNVKRKDNDWLIHSYIHSISGWLWFWFENLKWKFISFIGDRFTIYVTSHSYSSILSIPNVEQRAPLSLIFIKNDTSTRCGYFTYDSYSVKSRHPQHGVLYSFPGRNHKSLTRYSWIDWIIHSNICIFILRNFYTSACIRLIYFIWSIIFLIMTFLPLKMKCHAMRSRRSFLIFAIPTR